MLSGAGEETCGNTRCRRHHSHEASSSRKELKTVELPFAYEEHGERKNALVKVVLCTSCLKKLLWKHEREKEARRGVDVKKEEAEEAEVHMKELTRKSVGVKEEEDEEEIENMLKSKAYGGTDDADAHERRGSDKRRERRDGEKGSSRRRRSSRSLSPSSHRREREHRHKRKQRSP